MKHNLLLVGLIVVAMLVFPVIAAEEVTQGDGPDTSTVCKGSGCGESGSNNKDNHQSAGGVINGDNNKQSNTNVNLQSDGNVDVGQINFGATSVSNSQSVAIFLPDSASHYTLDSGAVSTQITSLYMGEVYTVENDIELINDYTIQKKGDEFRYFVKSSIPVLCYVINANDVDKVKSRSGAPEYDWVLQRYEHGWVDVVFPKPTSNQMYNHPSTFQEIKFTVPEDGRYALVIDTRVVNTLNGLQSEIIPNSIDLTYTVEKTKDGKNLHFKPTSVGKTIVFDTTDCGRADTTSDVVLNDFDQKKKSENPEQIVYYTNTTGLNPNTTHLVISTTST